MNHDFESHPIDWYREMGPIGDFDSREERNLGDVGECYLGAG